MKRYLLGQRASVMLWFVPLLSLLAGLILYGGPALAQNSGWREPVLISDAELRSWFPDITVDVTGRVHVIYDGAQPVSEELSEDRILPAVMYTVWEEEAGWRQPNDLHLGRRGNIFRPAIAADRSGYLHVIAKRTGAVSELDYRRASAEAGYSAQSWSRHVLDRGGIYMSDVAVDSHGRIHVVYEKWVPFEEPLITEDGDRVTELSDVFYRRSVDHGKTWTEPVNLSRSPRVGSYRVQISVDGSDVIHVTWDEGFDRWALYGTPRSGRYISSVDGGQTWTAPAYFYGPERTNAQTAAASDNRGSVLVVWRATSIDRVYYAWSADGGASWSDEQPIPGFMARQYNDTIFDAYDLAADSAGNIHLVAVGGRALASPEEAADVPLGVYHLVWDGETWSEPEPVQVYEVDSGFPEYPKLAISEGNQLHLAWFLRDQQFGGNQAIYRIFYSRSQSDAPRQPLEPTLTPTPTSTPTSAPTPSPTAIPWPTLEAPSSDTPSGLYTDRDETLRLFTALLPVGVLLLVFWGARRGWFRRLLSR